MKLHPLGDRVIVEPKEADKVTASGIIIPDSGSAEKPQQGTIIAVGDGRIADDGKVIKMNVKVGDTVLYSKYSPDEVEVEGKKLLVMREDSILAIIK